MILSTLSRMLWFALLSPAEFARTDDTIVCGDRNEVVGERASAGDGGFECFRTSEERRDRQDYLGVNIFR